MVIDDPVDGEFEGAGEELAGEIDGEQQGAGVEGLVAGHGRVRNGDPPMFIDTPIGSIGSARMNEMFLQIHYASTPFGSLDMLFVV